MNITDKPAILGGTFCDRVDDYRTSSGLVMAAASDGGFKNSHMHENQDRAVLFPTGAAVIDGIGGGGPDSTKAAEIIAVMIKKHWQFIPEALRLAYEEIAVQELEGGACVMIAEITKQKGRKLFLHTRYQAGDVRELMTQRRRPGEDPLTTQMHVASSTDQTVLQPEIEAGRMTVKEARRDRRYGAVSNYITSDYFNPTIAHSALFPGTRIVLASDGITGNFEEEKEPELARLAHTIKGVRKFVAEVWSLSAQRMLRSAERFHNGQPSRRDNRTVVAIDIPR